MINNMSIYSINYIEIKRFKLNKLTHITQKLPSKSLTMFSNNMSYSINYIEIKRFKLNKTHIYNSKVAFQKFNHVFKLVPSFLIDTLLF